MRRWLGIDGIDFAIQAVLTFCVAGFLIGVNDVVNEDQVIFGVTGISFAILAWRRNRALRRHDALSEMTGEASAARLEEIDQRLADLEVRESRVAELEERLEFAERLLARPAIPEQRARE
jgi:hypothetical protein